MAKRGWRDAHPFFRCGATVRLKDGTTAQCGRAYNEDFRRNAQVGRYCTQHGAMKLAGKAVEPWRDAVAQDGQRG